MDIALVSCVELPEPDFDMVPLRQALAAAGFTSAVLAWDDPAVDWSIPRLAVLRSTWNYPLDIAGFLDWVAATAQVTRLINPPSLVRWNMHKRYLFDVESKGVPIAPTVLVPQGSDIALAAICAQQGWDEVVIKPAVSAGSLETVRVGRDAQTTGEAHLRRLAGQRDVLVQSYLPSVEAYGERALICIDGEITHAVRKAPRFHGNDESVSREAMPVSAAEAALAQRVLDAIAEPVLYGRVDMTPGPDGHPVIMEIELIEPSLFFAQCSAAMDRFVAMLARVLNE